MRCPDDSSGRDATTLARLDAEALARVTEPIFPSPYGQQARPNEGNPFYESPLTILSSMTQWLADDRDFVGSDQSAVWPDQSIDTSTLLSGARDLTFTWDAGLSAVLGETVVAPSLGTDGVTFAFHPMWGRSAQLTPSGGNPSVWVVAALGGDTTLGRGPFSMCDQSPLGSPGGFLAGHYPAAALCLEDGNSFVGGGRMSAYALYKDAGGSPEAVRVFGIKADTNLHLWHIRAEADQLVLSVDGVEYAQATSGSCTLGPLLHTILGGNAYPYGGAATIFYGSPGRVREVVVMPAIPTATERANMQAYFARRYPELSL